jgi:hypothetical protein
VLVVVLTVVLTVLLTVMTMRMALICTGKQVAEGAAAAEA